MVGRVESTSAVAAPYLEGPDAPHASEAAAALPGPVVCIAGPTASGKSSLARRVVRDVQGVIVSADAMQVYRGMDVGTAKDRDATADIRMIDIVDPRIDYSVALYQRAARAEVDACLTEGVVPIVCGGTGLYLDAVIDDLSFPEGDVTSPSRRRWEAFAERKGASALHAQLAARDPAAAALVHPNNVRRVVRALELSDQGVSYAEQNHKLHVRRPWYDALVYAITMDRARLRDRIERRVDDMFAAGLVGEVEALVLQGLRDGRTASQAIGYKEVLAYLDGACTLDEAKESTKLRSTRYAKRQLSWLRRRQDVVWLDYERLDEVEASAVIVDAVRCAEWRAPDERGGAPHGTL